jgi:hypothetical protein
LIDCHILNRLHRWFQPFAGGALAVFAFKCGVNTLSAAEEVLLAVKQANAVATFTRECFRHAGAT